MIKKFIYSITALLIVMTLAVIYLSTVGIKTTKLNNNITFKIKETYPKLNFQLDSINLILNPINLTIQLKTQNPKIKFEDKEVSIKEVSTNYNLISFLKKRFWN